MNDFSYEEFFNNVVDVLGIGFKNVEYPKMATFNSLLCLMADVVDYNKMINESDNVYLKYAEMIKERRCKGHDLLENLGYYDRC